MKEVNKEIITKDIVSVYVSDDGKEFRSAYACQKYEEEVKRENALKKVEKYLIKDLNGYVPLGSDYVDDNHDYHWYRVPDIETFADLLEAYGIYEGDITKWSGFSEIYVIESIDDDSYVTSLSEIKKITEEFWDKLGYDVSLLKR